MRAHKGRVEHGDYTGKIRPVGDPSGSSEKARMAGKESACSIPYPSFPPTPIDCRASGELPMARRADERPINQSGNKVQGLRGEYTTKLITPFRERLERLLPALCA